MPILTSEYTGPIQPSADMAYEDENGELRLRPGVQEMFSMVAAMMPKEPLVERGVGTYDITPQRAAYHYLLEVKQCEQINDNIGLLTITATSDARRPKILLKGEPKEVDSQVLVGISPEHPVQILAESEGEIGDLFGVVAYLPENLVASAGPQLVQRLER